MLPQCTGFRMFAIVSACFTPCIYLLVELTAQPLMYVLNQFLLHDVSVTRWLIPLCQVANRCVFVFLLGSGPVLLLFRCCFSRRNANLAGGFAGCLAFGFFGFAVCDVGGLPSKGTTVLLNEFLISLLAYTSFRTEPQSDIGHTRGKKPFSVL